MCQAGERGSSPDYTQQPFLAFEVKSTRGHPSNTNSATTLQKARPCQSTKEILGIKSPSTFPLGAAGFLAEGTEAANCVVWAVFKWKTPAAENVAL